MIKKFFLLLTVLASCLGAVAQHAPGSWKIIPMTGEYIDEIVDTPDHVYYLSGGSLYSYDKEYQETVFYAPGQQISDSGIARLYYNEEGNYLMVVYTNANIDLIYSDGRVVNMPEIKDANLTVSKAVNHVSFCKDRIYIATDFGLVVYDDKNHCVIESAMLGSPLKIILANSEYVFIFHNSSLCYSPVNERHNSYDKFKSLGGCWMETAVPVDDTNFLYKSGNAIYKLTVNVPENMSFSKVADIPNLISLFRYKDGYIAHCGDQLILIDSEGNYSQTVNLPEPLKNQIIASYKGLKEIWAGDQNGIASYDMSGENLTVISEKFRPESSQQFTSAYVIPTPDGSGVVITSIGQSEYHPAGDSGWSFQLPFICEKYDWSTGEITSLSPTTVDNYGKYVVAEEAIHNTNYFLGGPANTLVDPVDPDLIYHANNHEGLILFKNKELVWRYVATAERPADESRYLSSQVIPLTGEWQHMVECIEFDQMGNLWIGYYAKEGTKPMAVLPKAAVDRLRKDPSSITSEDFIVPEWPSSDSGKCDMRLMAIPGTNKLLYFRGTWNGPLIGYDTKGTPSFNDDTYESYNGFLDQDGTVTKPQFYCCMITDNNGEVWVGTTSGIFVIKDTNQIGLKGQASLNAIRPKVSRNDGTNYADYLLGSETVLGIAVDPSNRKWIATQASGLYLVSADGTEIIQQFTADNSPLLNNCVYTVACDPSSNDVLIGNGDGMYLYSSTSAPAANDYSEVYVFPNPVRPEYTGWITINGLMDNSLIKIADMQGNVFWEGKSEGGMVVWDGCNRDGSRVRSGVYLVFASQNVNGSSSGAVAKIVVIN